ncbi:Hypothetical predicted protein [Cloeon dipterum]|uniref:Uncharacterized protein n=1 Tax=Cloeon dipterum TaxID=197152 RepID=A0A8S1D5G5_9INSE|nr:Hypothetical predicted protein [Cloeon dipterum]
MFWPGQLNEGANNFLDNIFKFQIVQVGDQLTLNSNLYSRPNTKGSWLATAATRPATKCPSRLPNGPTS